MFSGPVKKLIKIIFKWGGGGYRQFRDGGEPGETGLHPLELSA